MRLQIRSKKTGHVYERELPKPRTILGSVLLISGLVTLSIGLPMIGVSGYTLYSTYDMVSSGVRTEGTVVRLEEVKHRRPPKIHRQKKTVAAYHPVISFLTEDGQTVEYRSDFGTSPPVHEVGEKVDVIYDPQDPSRAEIDSFVSLWLGPILVAGGGVLITAVGLLDIVLSRRYGRKKEPIS
ncbi:MAG: DUF3592 domain-containing protein [bacterium]